MTSEEHESIPVVYKDELWGANLLLPSPPPKPLLGWTCLGPMRWVNYLHELTEEELHALGPLLARFEAALREVMDVERVYVCLFSESPDWPLHFHLIPRRLDLSEEYIGPGIFNIQSAGYELADPDEVEKVRERLEAILTAS